MAKRTFEVQRAKEDDTCLQADATSEDESYSSEDDYDPNDFPNDKNHVILPLETDTYGGAICAAIHFSNARSDGEAHDISFDLKNILAFLMHFAVLSAQFFLVYILSVYIIQPEMQKFHEDTLEPAIEALRNAVRDERALNQSIPVEAIAYESCYSQQSIVKLETIICFFWLVKMMREVTDAFWVGFSYFNLPNLKNKSDRLITKHDKDNDVHFITHTTPCLRIYFLTLVNGPRFMAGITLAYVGMQYLAFARTLSSLIMKTLSLAFIVQLDNLIFGGLASEAFHKEVGQMKVCYKKAKIEKTMARQWHCNQWGSTVAKLVTISLILVVYISVIHRQVEVFRFTCNDYQDMFSKRGTSWEEWQF